MKRTCVLEFPEHFGREFKGHNTEHVSKYIQDISQGLQHKEVHPLPTPEAVTV